MSLLLKKFLRLFAVVFVALFAAYLLMVLYIVYMGDRLAFNVQPTSYTETTCDFVESTDGNRIAYRYYHLPGERRTLLYSHGSNVDMGSIDYISKLLLKQGYNVLMYDYPGVGLSSGTLSEAGTYAASSAVYNLLTGQMGIPEDRIILYGRSVGCAPTLHLSMHHAGVGEVVVVSPFLSPLRIVSRIPIFPEDLFENYKNHTACRSATLDRPWHEGYNGPRMAFSALTRFSL